MVPESINDLAKQLTTLEMFPFFDIADCLLTGLSVREDLGCEAMTFSRKHPLACWMSTMLVVFASSMAANGLLGEPILKPFEDTPILLMGTAMWYLTFYTPFDIGYKIESSLPVKVVACIMKEIYRVRKIDKGVAHALELYPDALIIMIFIGTLKGNGAAFTKLIERLFRGSWTPAAIEFLNPSYYTKVSFLVAIIFIVESKTDWIKDSHELLHLGIATCLISIKLSMIFLNAKDPLSMFDKLIDTVLFGGIWDYLPKLLERFQGKKDPCKDEYDDDDDDCNYDFDRQERCSYGQKRKYVKYRRN